MPDWRAAWAQVRERMRRELGDPVFEAWIGPLNLESFDHDELKIGAAKPFVRNWVANHYVGRIEKAFLAEGFSARLAVDRDFGRARRQHRRRDPARGPAPGHHARQRLLYLAAQRKPRSRRRQGPVEPDAASPADLRQLHSGRRQPVRPWRGARPLPTASRPTFRCSTSMAVSATARRILLNAAALEFRKRGKRTLFLRAEDFMRHFLGALYRKDTLAFKEELRTAEVLIIDDLQHICRSAATASEFLYTVNAFADLRRRVVIAADRAPAGAGRLGRRCEVAPGRRAVRGPGQARPRHAAGHPEVARGRIQPPQARCGAAAKPCWSASPTWTTPRPRELIGVFTKLATYADLTKKPVTLETAEEAVGLRAGPGRQDLDRGHPAQDRGVLQAGREGLPFAPARPPGGAAAPGGDVSVAQADHPLAARDRAALRRPRPHHGAACLPPHRGADRGGRAVPPGGGFPQPDAAAASGNADPKRPGAIRAFLLFEASLAGRPRRPTGSRQRPEKQAENRAKWPVRRVRFLCPFDPFLVWSAT